MTEALVTDAHLRSVVAGMRALGRAGIDVLAVAPSRWAAGLWSRYAMSRFVRPDVCEHPDAFLDALAELADHGARLSRTRVARKQLRL
jgi:hypothetical protein